MKRILIACISFGLVATSYGQKEYKKSPSLGIGFTLTDFNTAQRLRTAGLSNVLNTKLWTKTGNMASGLSVSYLQGLNNLLDFSSTLSGSFVRYPVPNKALANNSALLLDMTATANLKLVSDKYWFTPYLTAGVGASKYKGYYSAIIPVGLGLQLNLFDQTYLLVNSQYRIAMTENAAYHLYHSFSVASAINKKKEPAPVVVTIPVVEPPKDRDGDGVIDSLDKCPDVKGLASLQGCPDRDGDGITDSEDKCPDEAGLTRYQGCPIPDTDKDGINDEVDKCPTVPGVARYQGCPIPDTDGDGVNDEQDKCINEKGPASNFGCPVIDEKIVARIKKAAENIFFATGSAKLLSKSYTKLNDVVAILKENPSYKIDIEGHTDDTGADEMNQKLSEDRAASVKEYIISKNVDNSRISSIGYGETKPIADNKTSAGRAKNRRVEMTVKNY